MVPSIQVHDQLLVLFMLIVCTIQYKQKRGAATQLGLAFKSLRVSPSCVASHGVQLRDKLPERVEATSALTCFLSKQLRGSRTSAA